MMHHFWQWQSHLSFAQAALLWWGLAGGAFAGALIVSAWLRSHSKWWY